MLNKTRSIFILIVLSITLTACNIGGLIEGDSIIFGTGTLDSGITNEQSTFGPDEDFIMELETAEPFGVTDITFTLLETTEDGTEVILEQWDDVVDPSWNYFIYDFHIVELDGAFEPGDYTVRIFSPDSSMIAEGSFTIQ